MVIAQSIKQSLYTIRIKKCCKCVVSLKLWNYQTAFDYIFRVCLKIKIVDITIGILYDITIILYAKIGSKKKKYIEERNP